MIKYSIQREDDTNEEYDLVSHEITLTEENVIVKFSSEENSVTYKLCPDRRFKSVENIYSSLMNLLIKVVVSGYTIKIIEYFERMYVDIGYDADDEADDEAEMSEAEMSEAEMSEAEMSEAEMGETEMSEAEMSEAEMSEAEMSEAEMSEAEMSEAEMGETEMSEGEMLRFTALKL